MASVLDRQTGSPCARAWGRDGPALLAGLVICGPVRQEDGRSATSAGRGGKLHPVYVCSPRQVPITPLTGCQAAGPAHCRRRARHRSAAGRDGHPAALEVFPGRGDARRGPQRGNRWTRILAAAPGTRRLPGRSGARRSISSPSRRTGLVVRQLEKDWEAGAGRGAQRIGEEYDRFHRCPSPGRLTAAERGQIRALAADHAPPVWDASHHHRCGTAKQLIRHHGRGQARHPTVLGTSEKRWAVEVVWAGRAPHERPDHPPGGPGLTQLSY